jgi:hypothetical protein
LYAKTVTVIIAIQAIRAQETMLRMNQISCLSLKDSSVFLLCDLLKDEVSSSFLRLGGEVGFEVS